MAAEHVDGDFTISQLLEELSGDETWCDLDKEGRAKLIKKFKGSAIEW